MGLVPTAEAGGAGEGGHRARRQARRADPQVDCARCAGPHVRAQHSAHLARQGCGLITVPNSQGCCFATFQRNMHMSLPSLCPPDRLRPAACPTSHVCVPHASKLTEGLHAAAGAAAAGARLERAATSPAAVLSAAAAAEPRPAARTASPAKAAAASPAKAAATATMHSQPPAASPASQQQPQSPNPSAGYTDFGGPIPQPSGAVAAPQTVAALSPPATPQRPRQPDGGHLTPEVPLSPIYTSYALAPSLGLTTDLY